MRSLFAMLTIATLAACASSGATRVAAAPNPGPVEGTYEYIANLPGQHVRGKMRVIADTVTVEPVADYCRPSVRVPDPLAIHYTCNGPGSFEQIFLRIDRRNPVQLSKWSAAYRVQKKREVCTQYAVRDGRQVCVQTTMEAYETTESRSGTLQVRRVSP